MCVRIDGSYGEGGGQILRTSLSLAMVTGQPFVISKIRAGRKRPGLLRQHLTAVEAAVQVCGGEARGAELGATELEFRPGKVRAGEYRFAVGTAGSATLVLQTVLPALLQADAPSQLTLEGGTHNPAAPPFDYLERVFLPLLRRMGPAVTVKLERYGFYPAGGGKFTAEIAPCREWKPLQLGERGELTDRKAIGLVANLPSHIAEREMIAAIEALGWPVEAKVMLGTRNSAGPGNALMLEVASAGVAEIFTVFGEIGVTAEAVGKRAAGQVRKYLESGAAAGEHLADQLLLPMALAGGGSFTAAALNGHARTNMDVIAQFLPVRFSVTETNGYWTVSLSQGAV